MKIYIVGTSGSGKSTLARQLAKQFQIKHFDIDNYRFEANWVPRPKSEFIQHVLTDLKIEDDWVICGNYRLILGRVQKSVDKLIWLDYPLRIVLWRVVTRTLKRLITREKICGDNVESWRLQFFSRKSIFVWVIKTYCKNKKRYERLLDKPHYKKKMIRVRHPKHLHTLLVEHGLLPT